MATFDEHYNRIRSQQPNLSERQAQRLASELTESDTAHSAQLAQQHELAQAQLAAQAEEHQQFLDAQAAQENSRREYQFNVWKNTTDDGKYYANVFEPAAKNSILIYQSVKSDYKSWLREQLENDAVNLTDEQKKLFNAHEQTVNKNILWGVLAVVAVSIFSMISSPKSFVGAFLVILIALGVGFTNIKKLVENIQYKQSGSDQQEALLDSMSDKYWDVIGVGDIIDDPDSFIVLNEDHSGGNAFTMLTTFLDFEFWEDISFDGKKCKNLEAFLDNAPNILPAKESLIPLESFKIKDKWISTEHTSTLFPQFAFKESTNSTSATPVNSSLSPVTGESSHATPEGFTPVKGIYVVNSTKYLQRFLNRPVNLLFGVWSLIRRKHFGKAKSSQIHKSPGKLPPSDSGDSPEGFTPVDAPSDY